MSILGLEKFSARFKKVVKLSENEEAMRGSGYEVNNVMRFTAGTVITGVLTCPDNCYFDGKIEGGITIGNKLVLGEHSEVRGQVTAGDLMARGSIEGAVIVRGKTIYCSTAAVTAHSFSTRQLVVEQGALLNMDCLSMDVDGVEAPPYVPPEYVPVAEPKLRLREMPDELAVEASVKDREKSSAVNSNEDTLLFQFFQNNDNKQ
jgi:cytoskeletal protein CcmA (bactofilin family)